MYGFDGAFGCIGCGVHVLTNVAGGATSYAAPASRGEESSGKHVCGGWSIHLKKFKAGRGKRWAHHHHDHFLHRACPSAIQISVIDTAVSILPTWPIYEIDGFLRI